MLKFFDRKNELNTLVKLYEDSRSAAKTTFLIGRRRIGKFVSKKNETLLCQEYINEIQAKLAIAVRGTFSSFNELFACIMDLSKPRSFTLIIDEFQEFG